MVVPVETNEADRLLKGWWGEDHSGTCMKMLLLRMKDLLYYLILVAKHAAQMTMRGIDPPETFPTLSS